MEQDGFGFDPLARFFLALGDKVRQAGSREEPIDHRGRSWPPLIARRSHSLIAPTSIATGPVCPCKARGQRLPTSLP
jgi:hypothetical protein